MTSRNVKFLPRVGANPPPSRRNLAPESAQLGARVGAKDLDISTRTAGGVRRRCPELAGSPLGVAHLHPARDRTGSCSRTRRSDSHDTSRATRRARHREPPPAAWCASDVLRTLTAQRSSSRPRSRRYRCTPSSTTEICVVGHGRPAPCQRRRVADSPNDSEPASTMGASSRSCTTPRWPLSLETLLTSSATSKPPSLAIESVPSDSPLTAHAEAVAQASLVAGSEERHLRHEHVFVGCEGHVGAVQPAGAPICHEAPRRHYQGNAHGSQEDAVGHGGGDEHPA